MMTLKAALLSGSGDGSYGCRRKSSSPARSSRPLTASQYLLPHKYVGSGWAAAAGSASTAGGSSTQTDHEADYQAGAGGTLPSPTHLLPPSPDHAGRMSRGPPRSAAASPSPMATARRSICRRR